MCSCHTKSLVGLGQGAEHLGTLLDLKSVFPEILQFLMLLGNGGGIDAETLFLLLAGLGNGLYIG